MAQYLGIITAYGAVAVLAWLVYLLYPRLIPAAGPHGVDNRWRQAGFLALAIALSFAIGWLQRQGWLFPGDNPLFSAANRIVILSPVLAFIVSRRSRAAVLIPDQRILRSLAVGLLFAGLGLFAYFSTAPLQSDLKTLLEPIGISAVIEIAIRTMLNCLVVAAFLALVVGGWSLRTALAWIALAIAATQVPGLLQDGFSASWLGLLVVHVALVVGLLSAVLVTRNIVWLWPVLVVLNLLQFSLA